MSETRFNPEMLTLARESRGLTQGELAKKTAIAQSTLSKYENGMIEISPDHARLIASVLEYPESLLTRPETASALGSVCMHHRKRESTPVRDLRRIQAIVNLKRMQIQRLLLGIEIDVVNPFPQFPSDEYGDPEQIAELVRTTWRIPPGPIKSLVAAIERAGAIVVTFPFRTRKLDAISQWLSGSPPLLFINDEMPWERIRFSLAHELGHLVMHRTANPNQEGEADAFASAFLMPARDIKPDLSSMSLQRAAELKPYWRVSMQALIRRAYNLDEISMAQYRRLFTRLSKLGYRLAEPYPLSAEEPYVSRSLIEIHLQQHGYTLTELSQLVHLHAHEFAHEYLPQMAGPIRIK